MKAYSQSIKKSDFVRELKAHQKADAFLRGTYADKSGDKFRGCAVGCSLESVGRLQGLTLDKSDHSLYPVHLGIPEWLALLEDTVFENVPIERSKTWPVEFAQAIRVGADLEKAKTPILVMLLEHSLVSVKAVKYDKAASPQVTEAIAQVTKAVKQMIKAHKTGKGLEAARSAASAAESAAWSAARSAAFNYYADRILEILKETK